MKNGEEEIGGKWGLFPDFCWIFFVAQVVLSLITTTSGCSKKAGGKNLPAKMEWKTSWYFKCIQNTWIHMIENTSDWQNSAPVELLSLSPSLAGFWTDILSGFFFSDFNPPSTREAPSSTSPTIAMTSDLACLHSSPTCEREVASLRCQPPLNPHSPSLKEGIKQMPWLREFSIEIPCDPPTNSTCRWLVVSVSTIAADPRH